MPRFVRAIMLAASAFTLLWLSSCGAPEDAAAPEAGADAGLSVAEQIAERNAKLAAEEQAKTDAVAKAETEKLAAEEPSEVTKDDYKKGSVAKTGGQISRAIGGVRAAGEDVQLKNIQYQLRIQSEISGWPKSHEAFMKQMNEWGMKLPELNPPYEYWYDAEDHKIKKRTTASAEAANDQ